MSSFPFGSSQRNFDRRKLPKKQFRKIYIDNQNRIFSKHSAEFYIEVQFNNFVIGATLSNIQNFFEKSFSRWDFYGPKKPENEKVFDFS